MNNKILALLQDNARYSAQQLADMLGITAAQAEADIKELETAGIVKGYRPVINYEKLSVDHVSAFIELRVTPKKECGFDEIAQRIMRFDEVENVTLMSGGYDLSVEVHGKTFQDIAMFVAKRLSTLDGVISTATHFVLRRYKEDNVILVDEEREDRRNYVL